MNEEDKKQSYSISSSFEEIACIMVLAHHYNKNNAKFVHETIAAMHRDFLIQNAEQVRTTAAQLRKKYKEKESRKNG